MIWDMNSQYPCLRSTMKTFRIYWYIQANEPKEDFKYESLNLMVSMWMVWAIFLLPHTMTLKHRLQMGLLTELWGLRIWMQLQVELTLSPKSNSNKLCMSEENQQTKNDPTSILLILQGLKDKKTRRLRERGCKKVQKSIKVSATLEKLSLYWLKSPKIKTQPLLFHIENLS